MIKVIVGNALDVCPGIIVHGCNAQGKMGKGFAKWVHERFPAAYQIYRDRFDKNGKLEVGTITWIGVGPRKFIVNAVTQEFYGTDGRKYVDYDAVRRCFRDVNVLAKTFNTSVNFPLIGCSLGGGDWKIVSKIIDEEVEDRYEKTLWVTDRVKEYKVLKEWNDENIMFHE